MCYHAFNGALRHYVCVACRLSFKGSTWRPLGRRVCPGCRGQLAFAGFDFAAPRRRDTKAWSVVAAVLAEGLTYDHRPGCGCTHLPSYRPRTRAQLRVRRRAAERLGLPLAVTLARRDAFTPESRDEPPADSRTPAAS
ncbi:hypothetical protein [Kitasatospora cheerisanensis]|uniref:Deoxyxylulose-5-phosphate synthase n=1 Tax=Kitasatospora cheerisanensis KCTC 2395 TaxID=1348663 RepID=A0A066ZCQ8_9ACTN|nr:hypothetical protein [Kitasatospora cheerisanensis]KDN88096.1 hypothetical protein KCH_01730 [Kitasatospora cheerisanensis KCTC 2395]